MSEPFDTRLRTRRCSYLISTETPWGTVCDQPAVGRWEDDSDEWFCAAHLGDKRAAADLSICPNCFAYADYAAPMCGSCDHPLRAANDGIGSAQPMIVTHELQVCTVCLHLLANGEYNDGTDAAARCAQGLVERWGELAAQIVPGLAEPCGCGPGEDCQCHDLGYHTSPCDGCGDRDHGDRFAAVILGPEED